MATTYVTALASAQRGGNSFVFTVRDQLGREKTLNLSPAAQSQLLQSLLAVPPASTQRASTQPPIEAKNVRLVELQNGGTVLEVTLGHQMTLQILLPRPVLTGLQKLLDEWASKTH
jgi:hypothetical protein